VKDTFVFDKRIHGLADQKGGWKHVPFRDCKLTRFYRDSFGGNNSTTMFACLSPNQDDLYASLSTLRSAESSRDISNNIKRSHVKENNPRRSSLRCRECDYGEKKVLKS